MDYYRGASGPAASSTNGTFCQHIGLPIQLAHRNWIGLQSVPFDSGGNFKYSAPFVAEVTGLVISCQALQTPAKLDVLH